MLSQRRAPMKWPSGKPTAPGKYEGTIYGVPFSLEITVDRKHSQRSTWEMHFEIYGEKYRNNGQSGGVQRALSCLRPDLETVCRNHGVTE
jgi:hypothetical protein